MRIVALLSGVALSLAGCATPLAPASSIPQHDEIPDPIGIEIGKIGARSSLVPTGQTPGGGWEIPPLSQPQQASWYEPGPEPGEPGTAVILGHANGNGRDGVFARLSKLRVGDEIRVGYPDNAVRLYRVTSVVQLPKGQFRPWQSLRVDGPPELRLITCGGELTRTADGGGRYLDNVVVSAAPV